MADTIESPKGSSVLDDLQIVPSPEYGKAEPVHGDLPTVEETIQGESVPEVKPVETKPPVTEPVPELKGKARDNFAKLEQAKKEAEERANRIEQEWKAKYEDSQNKIRDYETRISQTVNPEDYRKQIEERDQRLQALDLQLRTVALERHPDFIARFEEPKNHYLSAAKEIAQAAGIDEAQFKAALNRPEQLQEIRESLPLPDQYRFDAAFRSIQELDLQRSAALKNKDHTIQELTRRQQEEAMQQYQQRTQQNLEIARRMAQEPFERIPGLKDDPELQSHVTGTLEAIAGGPGAERMGTEEIMRLAAAGSIAPKLIERQNQNIQSLQKELEEAQKKLKEQESFIQERYGSLPSNNVPGGKPTEQKREKPLWDDLVIRVG